MNTSTVVSDSNPLQLALYIALVILAITALALLARLAIKMHHRRNSKFHDSSYAYIGNVEENPDDEEGNDDEGENEENTEEDEESRIGAGFYVKRTLYPNSQDLTFSPELSSALEKINRSTIQVHRSGSKPKTKSKTGTLRRDPQEIQ